MGSEMCIRDRYQQAQTERNKARKVRGLPEQNGAPKADFDRLSEDAIRKLHPDSAAEAPAMTCVPIADPLGTLLCLAQETAPGKMTRSKERKCRRLMNLYLSQ